MPQIYVLELGGGGGRWQISSVRGINPTWRPDGKEVYYFDRGSLMAAPIRIGR